MADASTTPALPVQYNILHLGKKYSTATFGKKIVNCQRPMTQKQKQPCKASLNKKMTIKTHLMIR